MVKAQRKTSHCPRRQSASRMEVETAKARPEDQALGEMERPQEEAEPRSKELPPREPEVQPEAQKTTTRDQSCQTDETQQSNPEPDHHQASGCCIEPGDPPLLQQPLHTSKSGIQQIIECFRSGTSQLKHMLLREVDTIFECKLCRSLFRGLPNLITHKEYYCLTRISEPDGPPSDDKQSVAIKDLLEAIYPKKDGPDYVVRLEPIQASSKAVFQYLSSEDELARYPSHMARSSHNHSPEPWEEEEEQEENEQGNLEPRAENLSNRMSAPEEEEEDEEEEEEEEEDEEEEEEEEEEEVEEAAENTQPEEEGSTSGVEDVTIACCLCGKDFNSRRSIRRHFRKMHQTKLEELRKFTETRTVPISLLSLVKGHPRNRSKPTGKSCPVCYKSFATKANVRRHFDEVHRGLKRDTITPDIATRPGQPLSLESTAPRKRAASSPPRGGTHRSSPSTSRVQTSSQSRRREASMYNLEACRCLVCKRKYSSQLMLRRHMRIVHKITKLKSSVPAFTTTAASAEAGADALTDNAPSNNLRLKREAVEALDETDSSTPPSPADSDLYGGKTVAVVTKGPKVQGEEEEESSAQAQAQAQAHAVSMGFDFKQLFCKLCKRQFSSRQNLTKHIELHTDGTEIFIKFYRCPLCRYESRRKRDVLRHITVVHKKSTCYLAKIMPKLENRAIKRPAEVVLNSNYSKRISFKEEINGRHSPPSPPVTRKQDLLLSSSFGPASSGSAPAPRKPHEPAGAAPVTPSPPVTRKQDRQAGAAAPPSPPLTRRSDKLQQDSQAAYNTRRGYEAQQESSGSSTEVRVTKNFSLHACDVCGRAFAKKIYLESHKRSHRNAMAAASSSTPDNFRKGVSTRSKALLW